MGKETDLSPKTETEVSASKRIKEHNWTLQIAILSERIDTIIENDIQEEVARHGTYTRLSARASKSIGSLLVKLVKDVQTQAKKDLGIKQGILRASDDNDTGEA